MCLSSIFSPLDFLLCDILFVSFWDYLYTIYVLVGIYFACYPKEAMKSLWLCFEVFCCVILFYFLMLCFVDTEFAGVGIPRSSPGTEPSSGTGSRSLLWYNSFSRWLWWWRFHSSNRWQHTAHFSSRAGNKLLRLMGHKQWNRCTACWSFSGKMHFPPGAVIFTDYPCTVRFYVHTAVLLKIKILSCLDCSLITDILEAAGQSVSPVTVYQLIQHHVSNIWSLWFFEWSGVLHYKPANSFLCV